MAYSNINKDNTQVDWGSRIGRVLLAVIALFFTFSSVKNILEQYQSLRTANERNNLLLGEIEETDRIIRQIDEEIREATTPAGMKRNAARYLGMGSEDDYWLNIESNASNNDLYETGRETVDLPNWARWWLLFTK